MLVHASCIAIEGHAILLRGPSGSGKSDLALRLIDDGAALVAEDGRVNGGLKDFFESHLDELNRYVKALQTRE